MVADAVEMHYLIEPRCFVVGNSEGTRKPGDAEIGRGEVWRKVSKYAAAVRRLPPCEMKGQLVGLAPGKLVRDKEIHTGFLIDLWQLPTETEGVGVPADADVDPIMLLIPAFADEQLADDGLAVRKIEITLHPHTSDDLPSAFFNALLDLVIEDG